MLSSSVLPLSYALICCCSSHLYAKSSPGSTLLPAKPLLKEVWSPPLPAANPSGYPVVSPFDGFPEEHRAPQLPRNSKEGFEVKELIKIRT